MLQAGRTGLPPERHQRLPKVYRPSTSESVTYEIQERFIVSAASHQQYPAKNPDGYCGIGGCGVAFESAEVQAGEKA
jgi:peptide methionine sulfoxide reductase MsrA